MSNSQTLDKQAREEENDAKAWALHFKANRERRWENFIALVPKLESLEKVTGIETDAAAGKITFTIEAGGKNSGRKLDYYPKSNRLLNRARNQWENDGLTILFKIIGYGQKHYTGANKA